MAERRFYVGVVVLKDRDQQEVYLGNAVTDQGMAAATGEIVTSALTNNSLSNPTVGEAWAVDFTRTIEIYMESRNG